MNTCQHGIGVSQEERYIILQEAREMTTIFGTGLLLIRVADLEAQAVYADRSIAGVRELFGSDLPADDEFLPRFRRLFGKTLRKLLPDAFSTAC